MSTDLTPIDERSASALAIALGLVGLKVVQSVAAMYGAKKVQEVMKSPIGDLRGKNKHLDRILDAAGTTKKTLGEALKNKKTRSAFATAVKEEIKGMPSEARDKFDTSLKKVEKDSADLMKKVKASSSKKGKEVKEKSKGVVQKGKDALQEGKERGKAAIDALRGKGPQLNKRDDGKTCLQTPGGRALKCWLGTPSKQEVEKFYNRKAEYIRLACMYEDDGILEEVTFKDRVALYHPDVIDAVERRAMVLPLMALLALTSAQKNVPKVKDAISSVSVSRDLQKDLLFLVEEAGEWGVSSDAVGNLMEDIISRMSRQDRAAVQSAVTLFHQRELADLMEIDIISAIRRNGGRVQHSLVSPDASRLDLEDEVGEIHILIRPLGADDFTAMVKQPKVPGKAHRVSRPRDLKAFIQTSVLPAWERRMRDSGAFFSGR